MSIPTLDAVKALDGRIFATLDEQEIQVLEFYRTQGRKYDVVIAIINKADPAEVARCSSRRQADEIMKKANSLVEVNVGPRASAAWAERQQARTQKVGKHGIAHPPQPIRAGLGR